jgi:hypothetical protein
LNLIKESKNPHYDIVQNGSIKVKDKVVVIGKTIKIIELDILFLQQTIDSRDFMNRQSGVVDIEYTNEGKELIEGIPQKLIDQINYTLDKGSGRPSDKFEVVDYFKMVDVKNNPNASHYTIVPLREENDQEETVFLPKKLRTFLIELDEQLNLLRRDFNTIKKTFFDGTIPTPNLYGVIQEDMIARTDTDDLDSRHTSRMTESSDIISIEDSPAKQLKSEIQKNKIDLEDSIAETNEGVRRRIEEQRISIEQRIQQGQTTDAQNQNFLADKIQELRQALTKKQDK